MLSLLAPCSKSGDVQKSQRRLPVLNLTPLDHTQRPRQRHGVHLNELVCLTRHLAATEADRHENVNPFVGESRCRVHREHVFDTLSLISRFLTKLSPRTVFGCFVRIQTAGWHLVQIAFGRVPVLPDHHDLRIITRRISEKRNDRARSWMSDHLEFPDATVRKSNRVDVEVEHAAGIDAARGDAWTVTHG